MHVIKTSHTIDFEKAKIVYTKKNFYERTFSKMINTHYHDKTMNLIVQANCVLERKKYSDPRNNEKLVYCRTQNEKLELSTNLEVSVFCGGGK